MRKFLTCIVMAAASVLAACVFESKGALIPEADQATAFTAGAYTVLERKESGEYEKSADAKVTLDKTRYTMTTPDGPMKFALYRIAPKIFLAQVDDDQDQYMYALLELTDDGAAITNLPCQQLNAAERARFHLAQEANSSCVFESLDDLTTAALYLKGRGETPSLKLVRE